MKKRLLSLLLVIVMVLGMLPNMVFAATDLPVNNNVIDIANEQIGGGPMGNASTDKITITGADVGNATQDGNTITVVLKSDTVPGTNVTATFDNIKNGPITVTQSASTATLGADGKATLSITLTARVQNFGGQKTYTIKFEIGASAPPEINGDKMRTAEIFAKEELTLPVSEYFTNATDYYLVEEETYTPIGNTHTASWAEPGEKTLVFAAKNAAGYSDNVTVTVTVKQAAAYTATVTVPEGYSPAFYPVTGISDGAAVLGDALTYDAETGTVTFPENISRIAWSAEGAVGMSAAVTNGAELTLVETTVTAKTRDGDADTAASVAVKDSDGYTVSGTVAETFLLAAGSSYTFTVTPGNDYKHAWNAATVPGVTISAENATVAAEFSSKNLKSVTAPAAATVYVYYQSNYSDGCGNISKVPLEYRKENPDGTVTYYYSMVNKTDYGYGYSYVAFYEDKISYAGYFNDVTDVVLSWDEETKTPSYRGVYSSSTPYGERGEDSILTNVNSNGHLVLASGSEFMLKAYRAWQLINSDTTNVIIEPEYNYATSNDNVAITPYNERNSGVSGTSSNNWVYLKANGSGVTYLEISYDAVHIVDGYSSGEFGGAYVQPSNFTWNASDPNRTALIVVQTDGNAASGVKFGIQSPSGKWDYEYDTFYFTGNQGLMSLKPSATSGVASVAVSHDKGGSYANVTGEEGTYQVPIVAGNNIIRITDGSGKTAYQVVRGAKISSTITNVTEGKDSDAAFEPGDTVRVTFNGMYTACPKISGIYNPAASPSPKNRVYYTFNGSKVSQSTGYQYNFLKNAWIEVTIPADATEDCVLTGGYVGTPKDFGSNIGTLYDASQVNSSGSGTESRSILPDIIIPVYVDTSVRVESVTLAPTNIEMAIGEKQTLTATITPDNATNPAVLWETEDETVATVTNSGEVTAVGEGSTTIKATADGVTASCTVTVRRVDTTQIQLNATASEIKVGESLTLVATVKPENATNKTVTWSSSDNSVATVEDGIVTAHAKGTAVITASQGSLQATCTVQVTQDQVVDETATVYFSVSHDGAFVKTERGAVMALQKMDVPYFDLAQYDLGNYTIPQGADGHGEPTLLHLFIYATEVLQCGVSAEDAGKGYLKEQNLLGTKLLEVSGSATSLSTKWFWNMDMNLLYYENYKYPADSTGWGYTADRIILNDGDILTLGHFDDYTFNSDSASGVNYLVANGKTVTASVVQGGDLVLNGYLSGEFTQGPVRKSLDIYYAKADALTSGTVTEWTKLGTTDTNGQLKVNTYKLNEGRYILAVAGQYGKEQTTIIVSTPGGIVLNVLGSEAGGQVQNVIDKIDAIGEVTLEDAEAIAAARAAYEALTDEQEAAITNYEQLIAAEKTLEMLQATEADKTAAAAVDKMIDAIGNVTLEDEEAIKSARIAYKNLTETQKLFVENLDKLETAEKTLEELKKPAPVDGDPEKVYKAAGNYLEALVKQYGLSVNSIGGEWIVVGMARSGKTVPADYYDTVVKHVQENINAEEQLGRIASENARVILALTAAGYDVTDVDGHDLLKGMTASMKFVNKSGITGPIWTLIALDSHNYAIPEGTDVTREKLIDRILEAQLADNGWALSGTKADADMTGMALQALAPYYKINAKVKAAVDKAVEALSAMQSEDGSFSSIDGASAESVAQIIVALTALGIDPEKDARFVKEGISALDALCAFALEDGSFKHTPNGISNGMATEQAYYALAAYFRFKENKTSLYDMSDVTIQTENPDVPEDPSEPSEPAAPNEPSNPTDPNKHQTKVEITEGGITTVPESLKQAGFDTPEEVKQEMVQAIIEKNKEIDQKNVSHYDVTLMYSEDGGKTWIKADETHFPANGKIAVTIPYPAGTDSTYDFTVVHMFTSNTFGKTPGDVEMPKVTKTKEGIAFEVTGLSPISVGWTAPKTSDNPQTGDNTNIALYTSLMLVCVAGLVAVLYFDRKRKYACKYGK